MSRQLMALFVASTVLFGSIGAQPGAATHTRTQTSAAVQNEPPLSPAGAAGIREAQGASDRGVLIASGLILAGIVAAMLLIDDDNEDAVTTTGSN